MGYFSNGTEGEMYQEQWCDRCLHGMAPSCPIWALHVLYSYRECNKPDSMLHDLIPRSADGLSNEQCTMFYEQAGQ